MKIWKLVAGILSLIICLIVIFQSCAAGMSNALEENDEVSGTAGILVAIFLIAGGIISIVTRNSEGKGGNIALIVLFGLAALVGFTLGGSFEDLSIWAGWCLINAIMAVVAIILNSKKKRTASLPEDNPNNYK